MSNELTGTVKCIFDEQTFASGFNKREIVVTDSEDKYPQDIKFECLKDKVAQITGLIAGDQVTVTYDLRGNEYNGKYYVSLTAWKIERLGEKRKAPAPADPAQDELPDAANGISGIDDPLDEDVPF